LSIYAKDVSHIKTLDPYRLQELYKMHPCAEHVVKKLLVAGEREGGKDLDTDISDCIRTLSRWQAMRAEDAESAPVSPGIDATSVNGKQFVSRYDWSKALAWASFAATDANGVVFWYAEKPHIDKAGACWNIHGDGQYYLVDNVGPCAEWRNTLEARPQ
jgi:hypothetical protein